MDRKSILIIVACFALYLVMVQVSNKIFPPKPVSHGATNEVVTATNQNAVAPAPTSATPEPFAPPVQVAVSTNISERLLVLTNDDARYTFTSRGGGLKQVDLLNYPQTVSRSRLTAATNRGVVTLNEDSPVPALAILGGPTVQGDDEFSLTRMPEGVRAEKTLTNGLRIVKDFRLTNNFLVMASVKLENLSTQMLALPSQEWAVGTATPMNAQDNGMITVGTMWFDGSGKDDKTDAWFENRTLGCIRGTPRWEFIGGATNVVWAAAHNQFFVLAAIPHEPAEQLVVRKIALPPPSEEEITNDIHTVRQPFGFETSLVYPALTLTATQTVERSISIYAGPKEYKTLARVAGQFNNNFDLVMGFGKISGIFSKGLLLSMNFLHSALKIPYGWAIVVITIIIKVLFWPLTQASTRSMKRMQVLQPQMNAIREKYKDDPAKMNRKVMEFMKENKMNPMSGCWPMLIQMPVFFGFFYMLRTAIELRGASFLWIGDLSQPDTLFIIPGINFPFNLLPLLMGGAMLWQSHLTPPSPGVDPGQQKLMRYLPLIFLVFLYNYSAGLALYWTVQNLLTILQTKLTKNINPILPNTPNPLTPQPKKGK